MRRPGIVRPCRHLDQRPPFCLPAKRR
jgi:hypothetical protein